MAVRYFYKQRVIGPDQQTARYLDIHVEDGDEVTREDALIIVLDIIDGRLAELHEAVRGN